MQCDQIAHAVGVDIGRRQLDASVETVRERGELRAGCARGGIVIDQNLAGPRGSADDHGYGRSAGLHDARGSAAQHGGDRGGSQRECFHV